MVDRIRIICNSYEKIIAILIIALLGFGGWFAWQHFKDSFWLSDAEKVFDSEDIPEWSGEAYIELNNGKPTFSKNDLKREYYQKFTDLDSKGRCGVAVACIDKECMPEGTRGSIGMIKPSGWQISKYDFIDNGGYLFNRCHLIGWQLTGENAEERNLITGTRYLNTEGMLPFESQVANYVRRTGNHVMYRVTPIFHGKELVARGVVIEAESVEDEGDGISFNVYCYNVQPGVIIDYKTGENHLDPESKQQPKQEEQTISETTVEQVTLATISEEYDYILNTNTKRFHYPDCASVQDMSEHNRKGYVGTREELIEQGYQPCGVCKP